MAQADDFVKRHLPPTAAWPTMLYTWPETQLSDKLNTVSFLFDRARENGWMNNPLFRSTSLGSLSSPNSIGVLTYAQVLERVDTLATQLQAQWNLPQGSRVLLRGGNSPAMAIAWLAVCKAGWVVVATMPLLRARELYDIVQKGQVRHALCDRQLAAELTKLQNDIGQMQPRPGEPALCNIEQIIWFDTAAQFEVETELSEPTLAQAACDLAEHTHKTDDIALLAFTSGTTGVPKAACHSHRDMIAACFAWPTHVLKARSSDIVLGSPPLAFTFGLGGLLLFPMSVGASIYYHDKGYTPESMIDAIHASGATISYTAPTFYRQMAPIAQAKGIAKLRMSVSAGEALPDATRQLWKQATHLNMVDGIGATELFHIFISSAGNEIRDGAIGKVVPGYFARIVDDNGNPVPDGTVGKLAVIGPTGCKYLADSRQGNYVKNSWNYPGDAFSRDKDGYYYYHSRADDMIISAGYNIAGPEVESCLLLHSAVAECGVVGKPDAERGMIVKAYCVLKDHSQANEATVKLLQDWVKQQLAPYKYPREISFVPNLPRTETGKLQRFKLREIE
jgi:2-aminobenzoate-CoA ligase